jgi:hypothetical protein
MTIEENPLCGLETVACSAIEGDLAVAGGC